MSRLLTIIAVFWICFSFRPANAASEYKSNQELDLWRAEKYDELYRHIQINGKSSKEDFIDKLKSSTCKPACCWEKMQEVSVKIENQEQVVVHAKVGLEGNGETKFKTRSYRLTRNADEWKISQSDINYLAGAKKSKKGHKAKKHKSKTD
jgi:hypothetical protein